MELDTSRRLHRDIVALRQSQSPVITALAGFLQDACALLGKGQLSGSDVLDLYYTVTSIKHVYKEAQGSAELRAVSIQPHIGFVSVVITKDSKYYVTYFPRVSGEKEEAEVRSLYDDFTLEDSERYLADRRSFTLEIDASEGNIIAWPIVLIQDMHEPMTKGMLSTAYYAPAHAESLQHVIDRILTALTGEFIEAKKDIVERPRPMVDAKA